MGGLLQSEFRPFRTLDKPFFSRHTDEHPGIIQQSTRLMVHPLHRRSPSPIFHSAVAAGHKTTTTVPSRPRPQMPNSPPPAQDNNDDVPSLIPSSSPFSVVTAMVLLFALVSPLIVISYRALPVSAVVRNIYVQPQYDSVSALQELCSQSRQLFEMVSDAQHCYYDDKSNVLGNIKFSRNMYSRQPYVSNGYIGARLSTLGQGFAYDEMNIHSQEQTEEVLLNGWPLFNKRHTSAMVAGFFSLQAKLPSTNFPELYSNGYDSVISTLPYWAQVDIEFEDDDGQVHTFSPMTVEEYEITNYHQNMSIKNGLVSTKLNWRNRIEVEIHIFAHKQVLPLSVMSIHLRPLHNENINVVVRDSLNFTTSQRTTLVEKGHDDSGIYMVVSPDNVPYSQASIFSSWDINDLGENNNFSEPDEDSIIREYKLELAEGQVTTIHKYIGVVSTELDSQIENTLEHAKEIVTFAKDTARHELFRAHNKEWCEQFEDTNIIFPSDEFLTMAARASLFHLLTNTNVYSKNLTSALGASGLSADSYGGMVFWDTDVWIIPGILPFSPKVAKSVSNYRNYTHFQAVENARQYGYEQGAAYPWTSGRFGNCTSAGPCVDYEYHINVDVALSSWALYLAGEDDGYLRYTTWPLLRDAANFLTSYVTYNDSLGVYMTYNLTDPDEYANHINNGAFTNAGIEAVLQVATIVARHLGEEIPQRWIDVQGNMYMPVSHYGITLEYSQMNASVSIKQADVVMLTFPLDHHDDKQRAIDDLFYYSLKQSDVGPAMTFPIFTVASRRLFNYGCSSQSYLQKSVLPYMRAPFAQFSEQADDNVLTNGGTHPAFPFLTAHGGYLQAVIYGVLGLKYATRFDEKTNHIQRYLKFDPVRPLALPSGLRVKGFRYLNQRLDVSLTDLHGIISHRGTNPIDVEVNCRNDFAGNYTLQPGETLTVPVFEPPLNVPGSVTECKMIANLTQGMPAEVPLSAIDGNNYTYWQAFDRSPARLFIDLGYGQRLSHGSILWGQRPAKYFSLWISEEKQHITYEGALRHMDDVDFVKAVDHMPIVASEPFDERYLKDVRLLPNNETTFELDDAPYKELKARFLMIEVEGTIDDDDVRDGATICEFIMFSIDGHNAFDYEL